MLSMIKTEREDMYQLETEGFKGLVSVASLPATTQAYLAERSSGKNPGDKLGNLRKEIKDAILNVIQDQVDAGHKAASEPKVQATVPTTGFAAKAAGYVKDLGISMADAIELAKAELGLNQPTVAGKPEQTVQGLQGGSDASLSTTELIQNICRNVGLKPSITVRMTAAARLLEKQHKVSVVVAPDWVGIKDTVAKGSGKINMAPAYKPVAKYLRLSNSNSTGEGVYTTGLEVLADMFDDGLFEPGGTVYVTALSGPKGQNKPSCKVYFRYDE